MIWPCRLLFPPFRSQWRGSPGGKLASNRALDQSEQVAGRVANSAFRAAGIPLIQDRLAQFGVNRLQGGENTPLLLRFQGREALGKVQRPSRALYRTFFNRLIFITYSTRRLRIPK